MKENEYKQLIKQTNHHKKEILKLGYAGCFTCQSWFSKNQIKEWVDNDETALCPKCRLDNVIPIKLEEHETMLCKFKELTDFINQKK